MTWTVQNLDLAAISATQLLPHLPSHLQQIIRLAESLGLGPMTVWIYGSRARGDARENSDFDLAFKVTNPIPFSEFRTAIVDNPPSVYSYDIVNYDSVEQSLRDVIERDGLVIHESE